MENKIDIKEIKQDTILKTEEKIEKTIELNIKEIEKIIMSIPKIDI